MFFLQYFRGRLDMKKEIHFYEYSTSKEMVHSWDETEKQIKELKEEIHTTQMGLIGTELIKMGYRVFVHESDSRYYEIVIGSGNERTSKYIREEHNLFRMWQSGAFSIVNQR